MNDLKLKDCPFCGGKPKILLTENTKGFVVCDICEASTGYGQRKNIIKWWNKRFGGEN